MAGKLNESPASPFLPLEDVDPSLFGFVSLANFEKVTPAILGRLVPQVTTYREFASLPGMDNSRVDEQATEGLKIGDNWVYTHHKSGQPFHQFFFTRLRTEDEEGTPIPSLTYYTSDVYTWHDVLFGLWFVEDETDTYESVVEGAVNYIPKLFPRQQMLLGGSFATMFKVEVFASHRAFPQSFFQLDVPVPQGVYWDTRNTKGSLPACLHDEVTIPEGNSNGRVWYGAGMRGSKINFGTDIVFPATNHKRWKDHVCQENQQQVNGMYMLERRTALIPQGVMKLNKS